MSAGLIEAPKLADTAIQCPGCGSSHTATARTLLQDNILCKTCGTCWYLAEGSAERIDPRNCVGCSLRRICAAAAG